MAAALVCEICGGKLMGKPGGIFECDSCGMEYSTEWARAKIQEIRGTVKVEGTVEVQGKVEVDNSAYVKKYLENARRSKEKEDWEEAEKYYNMVEQNDPNNIEAIFYSAYAKAKNSLISDDIYKRQAAFKVLTNCVSIIDDKFDVSRGEENETVIRAMATDLCRMITSNFVFTEWKNGYGVVTRTNKPETYALFASLIIQFRESINNIAKLHDEAYLHEQIIHLFKIAVATGNYNSDYLKKCIEEESRAAELLKIATFFKNNSGQTGNYEELEREYFEMNCRQEKLKEKEAEFAKVHAEWKSLIAQIEKMGPFNFKEKKPLEEKRTEVYMKCRELEREIKEAQEEENKKTAWIKELFEKYEENANA